MHAISLLLAAGLSIGAPKNFADLPLVSYRVAGLVPRPNGVTGFFLSSDKVLYAERLGEAPGRVVLEGVDAVRISADSAPRVAWQSQEIIYDAPLRDDDTIDDAAAKRIVTGSLSSYRCNARRCLVTWSDARQRHAWVVGTAGDVPLAGGGSILASDPDGFLVMASGKLLRVSNDSEVTTIPTPELLGTPAAADFDGVRYVVAGEAARTIAVASVGIDGTAGPVTMVVDERASAGTLPYRSAGVRLVWDGAQHLLVTHHSTDFVVSSSFSWPIPVTGFLLSRDLQMFGTKSFGGTSSSPAGVVVSENRFWVLWYDLPFVTGNLPYERIFYIAGATTSADGATKRLDIPGSPPATELLIAAAASDIRVAGVWSSFERVTHRYRVMARAEGDVAPITVGQCAELSASIANLDDAFLAVMRGDGGVEGVLRANGAWNRLDLTPLGAVDRVAAAANDRDFLVATVHAGQLLTARIGQQGEVTSARNVIATGATPAALAAASDGSGFALLWTRGDATVVTVLDAAGNTVATREIGPAMAPLTIAWSGSEYVAPTWRLSQYGELLAALDAPPDLVPVSIARAGDGVIATWVSAKTSAGFITALAPWASWWTPPVPLNGRFAAATQGTDAVLFGVSGATPLPALSTRDVSYVPSTPRRRAAR